MSYHQKRDEREDLESSYWCPICGNEHSMRNNTDFPLTTIFYPQQGKKSLCYCKTCYTTQVFTIPRIVTEAQKQLWRAGCSVE
jgi:transcription elongation factor Elf1